MTKFDKVFAVVILGFIIPVIAFCAFWWLSFLLKLDSRLWMIAGLFVGIILCIVLLRKLKLVDRFYTINYFPLAVLFIAYSIGIFGFFMGVPVFNVIPGILAGVYVGRKVKLLKQPISNFRSELKKAAIFSALILFLICCCSAWLALADPHTSANLQGMLKLSFEVTNTAIWLLIVIGGASLLLLQHVFLLVAGKWAYQR
jgi:hypothetical protein